MNSLRKIVGILLAMTLVAFALPGIAGPAKSFTVNVSPLQVPVGTSNLTASFANVSPPQSNSTINSVILTLPAGTGLTINSITPTTGVTLSPNVGLPYSGPGPLQIKVSGFTGVKPLDPPFTITVNVTAPAGSSCHAFAWSAQAFAGNSWTGDMFTLVPPSSLTTNVACQFTGSVNCGGTIETGDPAGGGQRWFFNKDGSTCAPVDYNFTNNGTTDGSAILKWNIQSGAAFSYTVFGNPVGLDATGWPLASGRPLVTWQFDGNGNPINKRLAVACVSDRLPTPYGALASGIDATVTSLTVNTTVVPGEVSMPAVPFPINVDSERMQVTAKAAGPGANQFTLTVIRGTGDIPSDAASHLAGAIAMSTPLPIDPNQYLPSPPAPNATTLNPSYQRQAQMCMASRGWTPFGLNPAGAQQVRWWSYIFDIGDGWITPNE